MKIFKSILPMVLIGSVALAGQSGQTTPKAPQQKGGPLSVTHPSTTTASTNKMPEAAASTGASADAKAAMPKISKEQAGTIAMGTMKGAEVVSSELKEVSGKQVWAVNLKEGKEKHEVMVDATAGTIVKQEAKHTKHHKEGTAPTKP